MCLYSRCVFYEHVRNWIKHSLSKCNILQILTGISAILLILAPMDDALPDTRQRAICHLEWANITNVARKQLTFVFYWKKQFKNQRRVWKHIILIVFVYHRIQKFNFAPSPSLEYLRHQMVTCVTTLHKYTLWNMRPMS